MSVAFLGTGSLGAGMVERMLGQRDSVTVWNRTRWHADALKSSGPVVAATAARAEPALGRMTGDLWHVGERSDLAAAYKLFGNSMLFAINAGLADVLAMAKHLDVPGEDAVALFARFNTSLAIPMRGKKMVAADFS